MLYYLKVKNTIFFHLKNNYKFPSKIHLVLFSYKGTDTLSISDNFFNLYIYVNEKYLSRFLSYVRKRKMKKDSVLRYS